ncbi:MAG: hypothetical protein HYX75_14040 [Acidobacteria bacterium]|nr:hypothetical protein [Acidobacteriota bacterium]
MPRHRTVFLLTSAVFVFAVLFSAPSCQQMPTLPNQEMSLVGAPSAPESTIAANELATCDVYITKSGTKYHRASCRYLNSSKKRVTLEWAKSHHYKPCAICKPPRRCPKRSAQARVSRPRHPGGLGITFTGRSETGPSLGRVKM